MSILKELDELTKAEVVSTETADKIRDYYKTKNQNSGNKLFIVFGVLGAILVGLGIILIIAHNWDELSKNVKVFFAFMPLVLAQMFCGFTLLKKPDNTAWKEASGAFLFFAVGASISLISQVYNISGDLAQFLFTWMLLCLPFIYIMRSSMVSLLYIAGITYYCIESHHFFNFFSHPPPSSYNYWWLLILALPHYYSVLKNKPDSNFTVFHNWFIPISLTICLSTLSHGHSKVMYMAYMSLFGFFYLLGTSEFFSRMKRNLNGYWVIGTLGTIQLLLTLSFNWFWNDLARDRYSFSEYYGGSEFFATVFFTTLALGTFVFLKLKSKAEFHPMKIIFLLFVLLFIVGNYYAAFTIVIINFLILANGIFTIRQGLRTDHLGILNYGLLTITALVVCRFFDSDMSFVVRGFLFMLVGAGFFASNFIMLRKRKQNVSA